MKCVGHIRRGKKETFVTDWKLQDEGAKEDRKQYAKSLHTKAAN